MLHLPGLLVLERLQGLIEPVPDQPLAEHLEKGDRHAAGDNAKCCEATKEFQYLVHHAVLRKPEIADPMGQPNGTTQ